MSVSASGSAREEWRARGQRNKLSKLSLPIHTITCRGKSNLESKRQLLCLLRTQRFWGICSLWALSNHFSRCTDGVPRRTLVSARFYCFSFRLQLQWPLSCPVLLPILLVSSTSAISLQEQGRHTS